MGEESEAGAKMQQYDPAKGDWFLMELVKLANNDGLEFGITLLTNGFLVSGILIGGSRYFETFAKDFSDGFKEISEEDKESFRKVVAMPADLYKSAPPLPSYIHLKDAKFFTAGDNSPLPKNIGVLWRGRLSEISGFYLGSLFVAKS